MLRELHEELGIPGDYELNDARPAFQEAAELVVAQGGVVAGRRPRVVEDEELVEAVRLVHSIVDSLIPVAGEVNQHQVVLRRDAE